MRVVVCLAVFCALFALSQASAINSPSALRKCQTKKIEKALDEILFYTEELKSDVYVLLEETLMGVLTCVETAISSLAACIQEDVQGSIASVESDEEAYVSLVEKMVEKILKYLKDCD